MDELCQQLATFHISDRQRRLTEEQDSAHKHHVDPDVPNPAGTQKVSQEKSHVQSANSITRPLLPRPPPGQRPCWEPPLFDYSWFEHFLEAGKEMAIREGNRDVDFRTDAMDQCIETELLIIYDKWLGKQEKHSPPNEVAFWNGLHGSVLSDLSNALGNGAHEVRKRHGKSFEEWCHLRDGLMDIVREKDPTAEQYRTPEAPDHKDFASWNKRRLSSIAQGRA